MEMKMKRKRRLMMGVQRKGDVIVTLIWGSLGVPLFIYLFTESWFIDVSINNKFPSKRKKKSIFIPMYFL